MAALVIDVGSWYHAQRKLQTAADAAALAGAQELPTQPSTAHDRRAIDYAQRNYAGMPAPTVTFPDRGDDRRTRHRRHARDLRPERINSSTFSVVTVHAHAQARSACRSS